MPSPSAALTTVLALAALVPATAAAGAQPAPARTSLGSIVYIRGANVWIARGDGAGKRQVTHDGTRSDPYWSPSEADDGTIAAARGAAIVRLSHTGKVLDRIDPPALKDSAGESMDGPVSQVALSPDGRTIAWTYVRAGCPIGGDCLFRAATGYTAANRYRSVGVSTYFHDPSWVTSTRTLQNGGYGSQVQLQDMRSAPQYWFDDRDYAGMKDTDLADTELSPDGRHLVAVRGYGDTTSIIWYDVAGDARHGSAPGVPSPVCLTGQQAGKSSPTWSPDSSSLAWEAQGGIWITTDVAECGAHQGVLAIPGGHSPDWSPAAR
ncbi:WD40 repeat protein [Motilibacter rhizosphaerae]|uniref:WD40 repeat protein n=1 Tax=Motilibacter rhizosphaerae TaxID=598652 RepID=A0A4Q7NAL6_9ACTN|nr:PD40 domain-containing protein [Motilibacter rhizosphaerae]RZS79959.1 WD40 repeat protein [Motilibacter rhizosphaerae]